MAEVKWIKLVTEFFDDEKIKLIESMPEADMVLIIWVKLLTLAGKKNMNGYIFLTENIPYTEEMLATVFNRPVNTIRLALETFKSFGMINGNGKGEIQIANWEKHQNIEELNKIREQNRLRQERYKGQHLLEIDQPDSICPYCGNNTKLTIDHIIPLSKGGKDEQDNKILCCLKCNVSKNNRDLDVFLNEKINFNESININAITHNKKLMKCLEYKDNKFTRVINTSLTPQIRLDKIREDKKENIKEDTKKMPITTFSDAGGKDEENTLLINKKEHNNIEFDFEGWSWHGIDDDIMDRWGKIFPNVEVSLELVKMREFFKSHPGHEKVIEEKFKGNYAIYIFNWLERTERYNKENIPETVKGG